MQNAKFWEGFVPLDKAAFVGATTEQNSGYISVAGYEQIAVLVYAISTTTTLDVDIEIATAVGGTNALTLKSATQLGAAGDDKLIAFAIDAEELSAPSGSSAREFGYLNVEVTPSGAATVAVIVLGGTPRHAPVNVSGWDQAV